MRSYIKVPMFILLAFVTILTFGQKEIVHDSEYYILEAQHGEKWKSEDKGLQEKIAQLKKKYGRSPNIIHIMWDDISK